MELVSHSEADAFAQCEVKHDYAHLQQLQPKTASNALERGNAGHKFMEVFLKGIKAGQTAALAKQEAMNSLGEYSTSMSAEAILICVPWVDNVWPTLGWKIVAVEQEFQAKINSEIIIPCKIDAIIEKRGELYIVDHKFTYDPYPPQVIRLMPQIPKYMGILKVNSIEIKDGIYNFMRTRNLKNPMDRYSQVPVGVNMSRMRRAFNEQISIATTIVELRKMDPADRPMPIHTINKMNCANCGFVDLCGLEMDGRDSTLMRKNDFEPNTYGYKELETV